MNIDTHSVVTIFHCKQKNYGGNQWLRAKTDANLKPKLKMKVVCCLKELGGEMKSVNENYFKRSPGNFQKSLPFGEIYVKYLKKISIVTGVLL